jgi:flagellar hook-basal body complex protein FliE
MNQEDREPQEQDADSKSKSAPPPVLAADTRESEKHARGSTGQCQKSAPLYQIARWDRFKEWASKITIAEAGMLLLTLVIAGSSIIYTIYAHRQWKVMSGQLSETQRARHAADKSFAETLCQMQAQTTAQQQAAQSSRQALRANIDSLHQIQRAFMNYEGLSIGRRLVDRGTNRVTAWQFLIKWENTGSTPARAMVGRSSFQPTVSPLPRGFNFPDLGIVDEGPGVLAPKGTATTTLTVPTGTLNAVKEGKLHLYMWGWTSYRDAFRGTPPRLTEYCIEVTQFIASGDLSDPSIQYNLIPATCAEHNCYDEDCPDYESRIR